MNVFFEQNSDMNKVHNLAQAAQQPPSPMPPPTPKKSAPQIIKKPALSSPKKPANSSLSPIPEPLLSAPPKQTSIFKHC
jgi:hypothetical protein